MRARLRASSKASGKTVTWRGAALTRLYGVFIACDTIAGAERFVKNGDMTSPRVDGAAYYRREHLWANAAESAAGRAQQRRACNGAACSGAPAASSSGGRRREEENVVKR